MRPLSEASFRTFYYEKFLVKILLKLKQTCITWRDAEEG